MPTSDHESSEKKCEIRVNKCVSGSRNFGFCMAFSLKWKHCWEFISGFILSKEIYCATSMKINLKLSICYSLSLLFIAFNMHPKMEHENNWICNAINYYNLLLGYSLFADITRRWLWPLTTILIFADANWSHEILYFAINLSAFDALIYFKQRNFD